MTGVGLVAERGEAADVAAADLRVATGDRRFAIRRRRVLPTVYSPLNTGGAVWGGGMTGVGLDAEAEAEASERAIMEVIDRSRAGEAKRMEARRPGVLPCTHDLRIKSLMVCHIK